VRVLRRVADAMALRATLESDLPGKDPAPIRRTGEKRSPGLRPWRTILPRKLVVHVLGCTVSLPGQKAFLDAGPRDEAVDRESEQDRHHDVDPPHVDHHFS